MNLVDTPVYWRLDWSESFGRSWESEVRKRVWESSSSFAWRHERIHTPVLDGERDCTTNTVGTIPSVGPTGAWDEDSQPLCFILKEIKRMETKWNNYLYHLYYDSMVELWCICMNQKMQSFFMVLSKLFIRACYFLYFQVM